MRKIVAAVMLFTMLFIAGCASDGPDKVIAEVNGDKITQQEYDQRLKLVTASYKLEQRDNGYDEENDAEMVIDETVLPLINEAAFNQSVMIKLVAQEAKAKGIELTSEEIEGYLQDFKGMQESFYGPEAYDQVLKDFAITEAELKEELAIGLLRGKLEDKIAEDAQINEASAQEFYEAHQEIYTEQAGMRVSHILVDSADEARDIIKQLQAGSDFATLAAQYSSCPSSSYGGELGPVNAETPMVQEFLDAALALAVGQITTEPVKSEFGYHVIKADAEQAEGVIPFAEVVTDITEQLEDEAVETYLDQLYRQAEIKDLRKK